MERPIDRPQRRDDLTVVVLDGEAVIYDERSEELHHLNTPATVVFEMCDAETTVEQMAAEIAEAFGMDATDVEPDVRTAVDSLAEAGLLEGTEVAGGR